MKKITLFIFIIVSVASSAQGRLSLVSAALKNSNANDSSFVLRDTVLQHFYYDIESDSLLLSDLKRSKLITAADVSYMTSQLVSYRPHCWQLDSIPHARLVSSLKLPSASLSLKKSIKAWENYFLLNKSGFFELSEPVFSVDHKTAIVYVAFQCGANCGNGGAAVYKFEKEQWVPIKNLWSWNKQ
ncbi:MAG: hypothetical protein EXR20_01430 [Bacteroidetes bacterium]|nr:hypothetical protein [Bacteroidota bacterium]PHX82345.1 MAG: hypothetical protein CK539_05160 [Flavobacteriales bacterium]